MFAHVEDAIQSRGREMNWQLLASAYPKCTRINQRRIARQAETMTRFVVDTKDTPSVYEQATPENRVLMIGSCLKAGGGEWYQEHPKQAAWLREQNISPNEALRRYQEWIDKKTEALKSRRDKDGNPVWIPAKKKNQERKEE